MNTIATKEDITLQVKHWAEINIGTKFEFREYQLETIVDIIYNILTKEHPTQIIEAPTGSGKSLLNIISAMVLAEYWDKESYILVSDLYLWKQYEDFVKTHNLVKSKIGIIKGQTGNYTCALNGEDMRNAECRMAGIGWANMFNQSAALSLGFDCACSCKYIRERKKAVSAKVVIMTYALYHYMVNVVSKITPDAKFSFKRREIIFCDECHNIPGIMKLEFTPSIAYSERKNFDTLYEYKRDKQLELFEFSDKNDEDAPPHFILVHEKHTKQEIDDKFNALWEIASNNEASKPDDFAAVSSFCTLMSWFSDTVQQIEADMTYKRQILKEKFTKEDLQFYKAVSWFRNKQCFFNDFMGCLVTVGVEYGMKLAEEDRNSKETIATYNIVKEDFISWNFLLKTAPCRVLMSATLGGEEAFADNTGLHYLERDEPDKEILFTYIPSTFNFETSPIHFLNKYKMSFAEKETNFPKVREMIYRICTTNIDKRGMIQTGSYTNAKEIYDNAPLDIKKRLLLYSGSKEKGTVITTHQMSRDTILIGPTLVEGIDLPGDQCSFIVIAKVPYPVITDKYTKEKMKLFPMWYNSCTSNIIIQGIGRGNRFADDECVTYILDACFLSLYRATKDQYPVWLQNRIKFYS